MDDSNTPSMRSLRKEKAMEADRLDILDAASRLFATQGVEHTSMSDIADETGFSVGKIYKFFPSKKSLFLHIAKDFLDQIHNAFTHADDPTLKPVARLKKVIYAAIEIGNAGPDQVLMHLQESPSLFVEIKQPYKELHRVIFVDLFTQGMESGQLKPHNPEYLALMLLGAIDALSSHLMSLGKPNPFTPIPDLVINHIITPLMTESPELDEEKKK